MKIQSFSHKINLFSFFLFSCSVCLVDFQTIDICRQTICKHIFHYECLDKWLNQHEVMQ